MNRAKDLADIELIETWLKNHISKATKNPSGQKKER